MLTMTMQSCYVHRHTIGNGPVGREGDKKKVSTTKQLYLFGGLIGVGSPNTSNPPYGENGYQIKTSSNIVDMIITSLTFGIVSTRTVKIFVKREDVLDIKDKKKAPAIKGQAPSSTPPKKAP